MNAKNDSILSKQVSPFMQLAFTLLLSLVLMGFSLLKPEIPYASTNTIMPWVVLCGMILFFALVNSMLSFAAVDGNTYWFHSIISFAVMLVFGGLIAWLISGVSIYDAGSVRWLYFVLTFGYLVFLSIVNLIKLFVKIAQKQDQRMNGNE